MKNKRAVSSKPWRNPRYKHDWRDICAILPAYLDDGSNGTIIYYADGTNEEINRRLEWVLNDFLGVLYTNKQQLHHQAERGLGMHNVRRLPLAVHSKMCLVPVNARKRINEKDSSIGYIVLAQVQWVGSVYGATTVKLSGSHTLTLYDSQRTLKRNLHLARTLVEEK